MIRSCSSRPTNAEAREPAGPQSVGLRLSVESCTIRRLTDWKNVLLDGEPIQAFRDFADAAITEVGTDGWGTTTADLPHETARSLERAMVRRALRLRGEDMIRASREGTAIRTKAEARCDAFVELLKEFGSLAAEQRAPRPTARSAPTARLHSGGRPRHH